MTADDMKETFLKMKGRPQPRATFRPEKDVDETKYFGVIDSETMM